MKNKWTERTIWLLILSSVGVVVYIIYDTIK